VKVYGVTGWKDMGKTTLVTRLVQCFSARGLKVSTIKHAHHAFDVDQPGRDSYLHRAAGASEVMLASRKRWALMHELRDEDEWELEDMLPKLSPVDLVLVEGYKQGRHPKIEVFRDQPGRDPIALENDTIRAIAGTIGAHRLAVPVFDLDTIDPIADFIATDLELG
jgi:molybdopterin-guanine dinucleotide biosynthesis protein MobB